MKPQFDVLSKPFLLVLGTAQDAGYPAAGCYGECCSRARADASLRRYAASLGLVDPVGGSAWIIDCTPDFREQLHFLEDETGDSGQIQLVGIFLTHAHMGHYAGLIHLGREAMDTADLPVYAMKGMRGFLESNKPWNLLINGGNISIMDLEAGNGVVVTDSLRVTPVPVPHRDECSETVGFSVQGTSRSILYVPDIDNWDSWESSLTELTTEYDEILIDGTFYSGSELPDRDMTLIPHPLIQDTISRLSGLKEAERNKFCFIHFNHSNPVLDERSTAYAEVMSAGFRIAQQGDRVIL